MKLKMSIENHIPLLKELLEEWKQEIGGDFTGFKDHIYRMIHYCFALQDQDAAQRKKVTITVCFNDIGIWTDAIFDYLVPILKRRELPRMCRNIKTLYNFEPPATMDEVNAASVQFVRKLSGFTKLSKVNEAAFKLAVERISAAAQELMDSLVTTATPKDRAIEAKRAKMRSERRFSAETIKGR